MKPSLSPDITVKKLLDRYPQLLQLFMELGLLCPGCPAEAFHTLTDVAREYHLDLNQLLQSIDKVIGDSEASRERFTLKNDGRKNTKKQPDILKQ